MQLIGQYDSPFVRRVAVALRIYGLEYEHLPWSTFGDADRLAAFNPLRRVPVLVLDGGEALIESGAILDYLDGLVPPERALIAAAGNARRKAMHIAALATGLADKAVSFFYSRVFHGEASPVWVARCQTQIHDVLVVLEHECATRGTDWWHRDTPGHADIAVACVLRFVAESHPGIVTLSDYPALAAHCAACEATDAFSGAVQVFSPPK
jgi:glutathione S-transferase